MIKKKLFLIALAFIAIESFSQITVTDNDVFEVGDNIYEASDTISTIQIGSAGANQIWDFSTLQKHQVDIIQHVDPISTQFGSLHPLSNLCTLDDDQNVYIIKSPTGIEVVGIDNQPLLNPILALPLPLTYPMQYSTGTVSGINQVEENIFLADSLAFLVTLGAAHTIDSINIQVTFESSFSVDGYGDVIIPMGTFPALRLYVTNTNTQTGYVYCTDTLSGVNSGWYPAPQQLFPTQIETDYFYQWWSNDPAVKFTLVNIFVDEFGNNLGNIQFLTNNITSIKEGSSLHAQVFPIPTSNILSIETKEGVFTNLELLDNNGRLILESQFTGSTSIPTAWLEKGLYFLKLNADDRQLIRKVVIK